LSLKNFETSNGKVYCKPHLPKLKARVGADNAEMTHVKNVDSFVSKAQYKSMAPAPIGNQTSSTQMRHSGSSLNRSNSRSGATTEESAAGGEKRQYRAQFNYVPEANDELVFDEGDELVDGQLISDGWLYATNKRTGKSGLVPEPYCERVA
jgi:hypothetical protein